MNGAGEASYRERERKYIRQGKQQEPSCSQDMLHELQPDATTQQRPRGRCGSESVKQTRTRPGGPLTDCGMATRRTQTSGRGRRAWPRDRARGGGQIRVVDPKPGTRTRGRTHAHHHPCILAAHAPLASSTAHAHTQAHTSRTAVTIH